MHHVLRFIEPIVMPSNNRRIFDNKDGPGPIEIDQNLYRYHSYQKDTILIYSAIKYTPGKYSTTHDDFEYSPLPFAG